MRVPLIVAACLGLAACEVTTTGPSGAPGGGPVAAPRVPTASAPAVDRIPMSQAAANFRAVVARVEPVAEQVCREQTQGVNCDFRIGVDTRQNLPPNAFQRLDANGRPEIGFTIALIGEARNQDEIAFVLSHEAAHHIRGHIGTQQQRAVEGAILGTLAGAVLGADQATVQTLQRGGATVNARRFAKGFELEADELGTRIALRSGYDAVRGAEFFNRIPDPGDRFLGTHPPNADRIATVRRAAGQ